MTIVAAPVVDSAQRAQTLQQQLNVSYAHAWSLAQETMSAITTGAYSAANGDSIAWAPQIAAAQAAAISIPPGADLPQRDSPGSAATAVTVANTTSLAAARDLYQRGRRPLVLNMANGATPGGGFLGGSRAQEEYLCRSSALYSTLVGDPMYAAHRQRNDYESSAWTILSPDVPVFRDDDGEALPQPWLCSFISCAAPVAHRVGQPRSAELMRERIHRVLAVAAAHGYTDLVLGAWGCGAFSNDAHAAAADFRDALAVPFEGAFGEVVFAITDWSPERRFLGPFRDAFVVPAASDPQSPAAEADRHE